MTALSGIKTRRICNKAAAITIKTVGERMVGGRRRRGEGEGVRKVEGDQCASEMAAYMKITLGENNKRCVARLRHGR